MLDSKHISISIYSDGKKSVHIPDCDLFFELITTYEIEKFSDSTYRYKATSIVDDIEFSTLLTQSDFEQYIQSVVSSTNE